jgi:ankyrin repeat protein
MEESFKPGDPETDMTPLHFAVQKGDMAMMRFLIERGADLESHTHIVPTPLSLAAKKGDLAAVKLLLTHGAAVKLLEWNEETCDESPLLGAATREIAATLIAAGADPCTMSFADGTPLHHARNREIAAILLDHGAHINARSERVTEPTPLHSAIAERRFDVAELLIERGADVNAAVRGKSPLCWVAEHEGPDRIAALLLAHGASVDGTPAGWPLREAVECNRPSIAKMLLKAGAIVPKYEEPTWTLLHSAASHGCGEDTIEMLLKAGAPVDARTWRFEPEEYRPSADDPNSPPGSGNRTPLHVAVQAGNAAAAKALLAHGADIRAKTADGETPSSIAKWVETKRDDLAVPQGAGGDFYTAYRKGVDSRNAARKVIARWIRKAD